MERDGGISEPQRIMKTKRIIIYGRVSTAEQRHDSQIAEVQDYCARRWGNNVGVTTITDTASGVKTSREGLDHLMQLVRRNKVDVVACFKLDRLGRSLPHLAQIISENRFIGLNFFEISSRRIDDNPVTDCHCQNLFDAR